MTPKFPNESTDYRAARDELLQAEIDLRRVMEDVAVKRRALPRGGIVTENYVFDGLLADGSIGKISLSELFGDKTELAIYNMMFPRSRSDTRPGPASGATALLPLSEAPCPSCTSLVDQLDGAARHIEQRVAFAIVAKTDISRLLTFGKERGWRNHRLLSSAGNSFNRDYFGESASGGQQPMLNVFERDGDQIRHFWGSELLYAPTEPGQEMRHAGTIEPLWNLFDMTRGGRGNDWDEQLQYPCCRPLASASEAKS